MTQSARRSGGAAELPPEGAALAFRSVLHPVGKLPAVVYWRRRALVLVLLVGVLGGGGWLATSALRHRPEAAGSSPADGRPAGELPASLAAERTPTRCSDEMIGLAVRAPKSAAVGSSPTFELVVTDTARVPCVGAFGDGQRELVLLDGAGRRLWSSQDCAPPAGEDTRTLAPGESVSFPVVWGGVSSDPGCAAPQTAPAPGRYTVRGRVGTKVSGDASLTLT